MGEEIIKYADAAMFDAQPILRTEGARVTPRVFILSATPDPLGNLAADMRMYRGDPVYDLSEITDEQRHWAWEELSKTHLNTPLEGVTIKFMIEAVTRSFTHQMVRQRVGAYYVQESLRFAVKRGIASESALPPSIMTPGETMTVGHVHTPQGTQASDVWHDTIEAIEGAYERLIALGIPAEDARGILPHCVTTRIIYNTNLRALFEVAGSRLCTQAQFEWRAVFLGMIRAIRGHSNGYTREPYRADDDWQWKLIAEPRPRSFTPVCYRQGKCAFMGQLDRGCTIRDRVQLFAQYGVGSEHWGEDVTLPNGDNTSIHPEEWMADPWAGLTTEDNRPK